LLEIIEAANGQSPALALGQGGQQHRCQDGKDGDDDKQLDQREAARRTGSLETPA